MTASLARCPLARALVAVVAIVSTGAGASDPTWPHYGGELRRAWTFQTGDEARRLIALDAARGEPCAASTAGAKSRSTAALSTLDWPGEFQVPKRWH